MATTYLSGASTGIPVSSGSNGDHGSSGGGSSEGSGAENGGVMNLVNGQGYGSPARLAAEMHDTKYLPAHHAVHAQAAALHNGHPIPHNPWVGIPTPDAAGAPHWAMHPATAGLYSQDLKQDIKPHSPADFNRPPGHHMPHHPSSWNAPPVSSPYLGMSAVAAGAGATGAASGAPSSPSPQLHHPSVYMSSMMQSQMAHPFGPDRYHHRDSHNSSPRSGTDEDGMQTPTSGTSSTTSFFPDSSGTQNNKEKMMMISVRISL